MATPPSLLSPSYSADNRSPTHQPLPIGPTPSSRARSGSVATSLTLANPALGHVRSASAVTARSGQPGDSVRSATPTSPNFSAMGGGTHAGGVLPPASFFRPARPNNYQPQPSVRPISQHSYASSRRASGPLLIGDRHSRTFTIGSDNEDEVSVHIDSTFEDADPAHPTPKSREVFAPVGTPIQQQQRLQPTPRSPIHSPVHPLPTIPSTPPHRRTSSSAPSRVGAGVRDSIERMFRRLSADSTGRRSSIPRTPAARRSSQPNTAEPVLSPVPIVLEKRAEEEEEESGGTLSPRTSGYQTRDSATSPRMSAGKPAATSLEVPHPKRQPGEPPLSNVPRTDEQTHKVLRNYALHPSRNRFFLSGRLMTGGDQPYAFIGSFVLVCGIAGAWFGTTCVWWWKHQSPAVAGVGAYMCLLTISTMLSTALRDPGILPRNLDPDPPYAASTASDGGSSRMPLPRDLKVRAGVVRVKYCPTCKMYRPPRSSHCKMCDNCVEGCDHHCQWVNNCVGHRNYTTFFAFLMSAVLTLALVICTSGIHLYLLTRRDHVGFGRALGKGAGSAVAFSLSIVVIWPITALLVYHMRLLLLNVTTIEQIRNTAHKQVVKGPAPPNPFTHGSWRRNLLNVLCRPEGASWLDARGIATEDRREVNPGLKIRD